MDKKTYLIIRLGATIVIAAVVAIFVNAGNYIMPIVVVFTGMLFLYLAKRQVKEVLADERDYDAAGKASRTAILVYSFIGFLAMMILLSLREQNPYFEAVAITLAYSICFLMILYSLIFKYYSKNLSFRKNTFSIVLGVLVLLALLVLGARLFSGEDSWICDNGEWVKHGNPDFPAPEIPCE